ncbi:MAG: glycosyltransferase family 2 protein [Hyphomicrobiales bacterium]|jgi:N-acetylglucosaminyl-diphospho-decaprenol L-rhamnosyltransferase|nr:glycosyltransferase family 2 protein [Hyphomicrobiales bacterium]
MFQASDVTAIVVAYNSAAVLPACLKALRAEGAPVVVVDNASTDASAACAEAEGATVIRSLRNEGYGRGNGLGVAAATTRFVLVCNPDLVVSPGALANLLAAMAMYPQAGLAAPLIIEPDGRIFVQPRSLLSPDHLNQAARILVPDGPASIPFVSGACLLIERSLFDAIGGFDPNIFLYYEDDDLCRRLMDMGRAPLLVPGARVSHARGTSIAPAAGRGFKLRWHFAWSRHYIGRKYGLPAEPAWKAGWTMLRAVLNAMIFNAQGYERYAGSAAGSLAFRRGETALAREGLS